MKSSEKPKHKEHSEEEYKKAIKVLKSKYINLNEKTKNLEQKYIERVKSYQLQPMDIAIEMQNDKMYPEIKFKPKSKKVYDFVPYENERLLRTALNHLEKMGITYEMVFRCCDKESEGSIPAYTIKQFLTENMNLNCLSDQEIQTLVAIFDEDCNGTISWDEFKTVIIRYSMNTEGDYLTDCRTSDKEILNKISKFFQKKKLEPVQAFQKIKQESPNGELYITGQEIQKYFDKNDLIIKDMELYCLLRIMDPERKNQVRKSDFIREMQKIQDDEVDLEIEMKKFKQYFVSSNVQPIQVYKIADKDKDQHVDIEVLAQTIAQFVKLINYEQAMYYLQLIDSNGNQDIDILEYELSLITEEDLDNLKIFSKNEIVESEVEFILQKLKDKMEDMDLTTGQLFKRFDRNLSGEISLIELRSGLIDLGFSMNDVVSLMKIFDRNFNGIIEVQEFMTVFGEGEEEKQKLAATFNNVDENFENDKQLLVDAVQKLRRVFVAYYPGLNLQHQKIFQQFDKNKDGVLSRKEFVEGLDTLESKVNLIEKQKQLLVRYIDKDENNIIDFEEFHQFLQHFEPDKVQQQDLRQARKLAGPTPQTQNFMIKPSTSYKEQYGLIGDQPAPMETEDEKIQLDKTQQSFLKKENNNYPTKAEVEEEDEGGDMFGEEEDDKGAQAGAMKRVPAEDKNIDLEKQSFQKDNKDNKDEQITEKGTEQEIESSKINTNNKRNSLVKSKYYTKPTRVYVIECLGILYIIALIIVLLIWLNDLYQNEGFSGYMFLKTKSESDIQKLYQDRSQNEKDIALIIQKNLNQYFPSMMDYIIILSETVLILFLFGFDLKPAKWKYMVNTGLMVKDALTIVWLLKEETFDNTNVWTFAGFGYFLGRTICSVPFFITIVKILTIRLYVFQQNPGMFIKLLLKIIYLIGVVCAILGCMHFTIGIFIFLIPVFPLWFQFNIIFYIIYTFMYSNYKSRKDVDPEQKQQIARNEQLIWNFDAFSIKRCGALSLYAILIPQIIMAGSIVSDENANFTGFWTYFYSSSLQIMTNVFSTNVDDFDLIAALYRYLLGF